MRLTNYTNYALRTLIFAALRHPALVRVQDVADAHAISRAHLVKCVHQLGRWGYLDNQRGRGGGFRLARPPETITVGEIVRRTEDGFGPAGEPPTDERRTDFDAALDGAFDRARDAFLAVLDRHSIRDVMENADELAAVLGVEIVPQAATAAAPSAAISAMDTAASDEQNAS